MVKLSKRAKQLLEVVKIARISPIHKANTKYVDISKWTTIMSRRNAGPFLEFFDHLLKVNIVMTAYEVPP